MATTFFKPTAAHIAVRDAFAEIARVETRDANHVVMNHIAEVDLGLANGSSPKVIATVLLLTHIVGVCPLELAYILEHGIDPLDVTFICPESYAVLTDRGYIAEPGLSHTFDVRDIQFFAIEAFAEELAASVGGRVVDPRKVAV